MHEGRTTPVGIKEALRELAFDPKTGDFRWMYERGPMHAGALAGQMSQEGLWIEAVGCHLLAHELAWYMVYGTWPPAKLKHLNGNLADNRSINLRLRGAIKVSEEKEYAGNGSSRTDPTRHIAVVIGDTLRTYETRLFDAISSAQNAEPLAHYVGRLVAFHQVLAFAAPGQPTLDELQLGSDDPLESWAHALADVYRRLGSAISRQSLAERESLREIVMDLMHQNAPALEMPRAFEAVYCTALQTSYRQIIGALDMRASSEDWLV